jgi:hypothetical protein
MWKPGLFQSISRREFVWNSFATAVCWALGRGAEAAPANQEAAAVHNCMLVGNQTAFLSHLPMFQRLNQAGTEYLTPHRFQVILQASFVSSRTYVTNVYFAERQGHPETRMFTVEPKPFVLPELTAAQPLTSFQGTVFRGHVERGGQAIDALTGTTVRVERVIHFHRFDPKEQAADVLAYLLFGRGKELFLAHLIVKPPDFDQILSIEFTGPELTDNHLGRATLISVPDRKNLPSERIKEGQQVAAKLPSGTKVTIQALREFYFEEGELQIPPTFDPTPEEVKAGFSD